jgi:hypothetical protein
MESRRQRGRTEARDEDGEVTYLYKDMVILLEDWSGAGAGRGGFGGGLVGVDAGDWGALRGGRVFGGARWGSLGLAVGAGG